MASAAVNLSAGRGEAVTFNGTHQTSATNATAVDITNWTIKVMAKDNVGNTVLDKTASVTSGPSGTYSFAVAKADTLLTPATYYFDVWRTDSGNEKLMGYGSFTITPDVRF